MSAILFNNPYAAPPPPANGGQTTTPALALAPIGATGAAQDTQDGSTLGNTGTGSETSKQAENVALLQKKQSFERPTNATGGSVVNAQAQTPPPTTSDGSDEEFRLGPDLPEVEMPDPLPTSPVLLNLRKAS